MYLKFHEESPTVFRFCAILESEFDLTGEHFSPLEFGSNRDPRHIMITPTKPPHPPSENPMSAPENTPQFIPLSEIERRQKKPFAFLKFLTTVVLGILFGMALFLVWLVFATTEEQRERLFSPIFETTSAVQGFAGLQSPITMLVMGVDVDRPGSQGNSFEGVRSDTMMLVKLDPSENTINIISIPRDSRVSIPGYGTDKVNAAFAYGGLDKAKETVQSNFGVTLDRTLVINTAGVRDVVDALGGIDVYVDQPMRYRDYSAKLFIDLQPGLHHLSGSQAEGFLRFRHDALGDIGRIRRQQVFMSAVLKRIKDPTVWLSLPHVIDVGRQYIQTDMNNAELISIATYAKGIGQSGFQVGTIPGGGGMGGGVSYWNVDPQRAEMLINRLIQGVVPLEESTQTDVAVTVGLLYTKKHSEDVTYLEAQVEAQGWKVACRSPQRSRHTQLVVHNMAKTSGDFDKLRHISSAFENLQLIFAPVGSTFETNSCGNTDFTIVLGDNTRSLTE